MANSIKVNKNSVTLPIERTEKYQLPFFKVYAVRAHRIVDDTDITREVVASRVEAERIRKETETELKSLYDVCWIYEQVVWC